MIVYVVGTLHLTHFGGAFLALIVLVALLPWCIRWSDDQN
jgi:hypothetical protein